MPNCTGNNTTIHKRKCRDAISKTSFCSRGPNGCELRALRGTVVPRKARNYKPKFCLWHHCIIHKAILYYT
jgi:hypothetical protein